MKKLLALITAICVFMVVSKPVFAVEVKTSTGSIGDIGIEGYLMMTGTSVFAKTSTSFNPDVLKKLLRIRVRYVDGDRVYISEYEDNFIEGTNAYSTSISITRNYKEVLGAQGHHYVKVYLANEISLTEKVGTINMRTY